jgi:serine/threonine-protein phosphatase 2A regulatory subunit B''
VADVDGDGVLSASDLRYFYREQEQRMRSYGMEVISFSDLLCQMTDLLRPREWRETAAGGVAIA